MPSDTERSDRSTLVGSLVVGLPLSEERPGMLDSFARSTLTHCLPDVGSAVVEVPL